MSHELQGPGRPAPHNLRYEVSANSHEPLALGDVTRYVDTLRVRGAEDYGRMSVALLVYRKNGSIVRVNGHVHVGDRRSTARIGEHAGVGGHLDEPSDPVVFHRQPRANERRRACPKAQSSTWNIAEHVPPIKLTGGHAWSREGALRPDSRRFTARRRCASCEQQHQRKRPLHHELSQIPLCSRKAAKAQPKGCAPRAST